jgi:hypothetical protein
LAPGKRISRTSLNQFSLNLRPATPALARRVLRVLRRLPPLTGPPIRLFAAEGLRQGSREAHAGSFLRERSIGFNCPAPEFPRICIHELFHFVWLRLGNPRRRSYEEILRKEWAAGARGELGWSAEWRKEKLTARDVRVRSRFWLEYCCESFCDTAAWMYAGVRDHEEFTLAGRYRFRRRAWFMGITRLPLLV